MCWGIQSRRRRGYKRTDISNALRVIRREELHVGRRPQPQEAIDLVPRICGIELIDHVRPLSQGCDARPDPRLVVVVVCEDLRKGAPLDEEATPARGIVDRAPLRPDVAQPDVVEVDEGLKG